MGFIFEFNFYRRLGFLVILCLLMILEISCNHSSSESYLIGVNPENNEEKVIVRDYYQVIHEPWYSWESSSITHYPKYHIITLYKKGESEDLSEIISDELGKHYGIDVQEKFNSSGWNDFEYSISAAYLIDEDYWVLVLKHLLIYNNGKIHLIDKDLYNVEYTGKTFFLNSINNTRSLKEDIYIFDVKTGINSPSNSINEGLLKIPELMAGERSDIGEIDFAYDPFTRVSYFITYYKTELFNHNYYLFTKNGKWKIDEIKLGDNQVVRDFKVIGGKIFLDIINTNAKPEQLTNEIYFFGNGSLKRLNVKGGRFLFYKDSLYASDFKYQNIVKISSE